MRFLVKLDFDPYFFVFWQFLNKMCLVPNEASFKRLSKTCTAFDHQRIYRGDILKTINSSSCFTCLAKDFSPFWNKDNKPPKQKAICLKMLRNKTVTNHLSGEKRIITIDPSVYPYDPFLCRHFDLKALYQRTIFHSQPWLTLNFR